MTDQSVRRTWVTAVLTLATFVTVNWLSGVQEG